MQTKETWADLKKRARWDRIFSALAVLLLVLILLISSVSSCVKRSEKESEVQQASYIEPVPSLQPVTEAVPDNSRAIYLSPSTQEDNVYACDSTITEEAAMWRVARRLKVLLEDAGYQVYLCGEDDTVMDKVEQGNTLKCGAYVAIHSNSGGESGDGKGTEIFYNTEISGSLALAEYIYNRVAALTPTEDRGIKDQTQRDLYEIKNNQSACCLLEVEFHDDLTTSRWILEHTDELAESIRDGIVDYLNNQASQSNYHSNQNQYATSTGLPPLSGDGYH